MTQKDFEHIAPTLRAKALTVARGFGFSADEAEDVAQDVLLKLWCVHERLTPEESLATVVAKRCCIDKVRLRHHEEEIDEYTVPLETSNQHDQLEYEELERWLFRQIDQLPSSCGIILRMRQLEHRELDEIATLLGITKSSVSTLLSRARRQLLQELKRRNQQ